MAGSAMINGKPPEGQKFYYIRNWKKFQHYKDRDPPWIKLHNKILDSEDWIGLSDFNRLVMVCCLAIASRYGGHVPASGLLFKRICRLNAPVNFKPLIDCGFLMETLADASSLQADAPQRQSTEAEAEKEQKYAFEEGQIRITQKQIDRWQKAFPDISVIGQLHAMAAWASSLPKKQWFPAVANLLAKRDQAAKAALRTGQLKRVLGGGTA